MARQTVNPKDKILSLTSNKKYLKEMFDAMAKAGIEPISIKKVGRPMMTKAGKVASTYAIQLNDGSTLRIEIMSDGKLGAIEYDKTIIRNREEGLTTGGAKAGTQIAKTSLAKQKRAINKKIDTTDIEKVVNESKEVDESKQQEIKQLTQEVEALRQQVNELRNKEIELSKAIGNQPNE